jgi:hypothetical protein
MDKCQGWFGYRNESMLWSIIDWKKYAGMSMDGLRELYGHSSKLMTEKIR